MSIKISPLNLTKSSNKTSTEIFIAQPDSLKETLAGKLFVVVEIEEKSADSIKVINYIIDSITNNYYNNEKIFLREKVPSLKVEHIFESSLAKVNEKFTQWYKEENITIPLNKINITLGLIYKNEIHAANHGSNKGLLAYPDANDGAERENYKIADIFSGKKINSKNSKKIFHDVISGYINQGTGLLICNEVLPEYIFNKELTRTLSTLPASGATEHIKNKLKELNTFVSFIGIVIKNSKQERNTQTHSIRSNPAILDNISNDSIINLNQTEDSTEELLTPPGVLFPKKWLKIFKKNDENKQREMNLDIKERIWMKKKRPFLDLFKLLGKLTMKLFSAILRIFSLLSALIIKGLKKIQKIGISKALAKAFTKLKNAFMALGLKNKILIIIAVISLVLFSYNISKKKIEIENEAEQKNYTEISSLIEQKQNKADASLLYSDEDGAKKLYEEIKELLNELPEETEEQIKQHQEFEEKYTAFLEKIRNVIRVDEPERISDLKNLLSGSDPLNMELIGNKLYLGDTSQKSLYNIDLDDDLATVITDTRDRIESLGICAVNENMIYYFNNDLITQFNADNDEFLNLSINPGDANVSSAAIFRNRLYLSDVKNGQILRFNLNGSSYSAPYAWINNNTDLSGAVSMAIDGDIYLLFENGELLKYYRGDLSTFKLEAIDPPLENGNKLRADQEGDNIYILDKNENRIVVFDKQGQFIYQLKYPGLSDLKDFVVDIENKLVYLLNGTQVYKSKLKE